MAIGTTYPEIRAVLEKMILLVRTRPCEQCVKHTDGMSVLLVDMRDAVGNGLTINPIQTMMNHASTELFFDDLRVPA